MIMLPDLLYFALICLGLLVLGYVTGTKRVW